MKESIKSIIITIVLIIPMMSKAQLNETILFTDIKEIINEDFRRTVEEDLDDWEIEYESDFHYEPNSVEAFTFLDFPISSASFFISENNQIEKFGLRIIVEDGNEFYRKMFETYGNSSVCSPSPYYFEKHNVRLPKEDNEEALELLSKIPMPTLEDYKDTNSITWSKVKNQSVGFRVKIKIYNLPFEGNDFASPQRILRVLFEKRYAD